MLFPCLEHSSCPLPFFFPWWLFLILQECLFLWQVSQTPGLVRPSAWWGPGCPSTYHLVLHLQTPILHGTWHAGRSQRQAPEELKIKDTTWNGLCGSTRGHAEDWEMPKNTSQVSYSPREYSCCSTCRQHTGPGTVPHSILFRYWKSSHQPSSLWLLDLWICLIFRVDHFIKCQHKALAFILLTLYCISEPS